MGFEVKLIFAEKAERLTQAVSFHMVNSRELLTLRMTWLRKTNQYVQGIKVLLKISE